MSLPLSAQEVKPFIHTDRQSMDERSAGQNITNPVSLHSVCMYNTVALAAPSVMPTCGRPLLLCTEAVPYLSIYLSI